MFRPVPAAVIAAVVADSLFADPQRLHPVAGFGQLAATLERKWWADSVVRGALVSGALIGGAAATGAVAERLCRGRMVPTVALHALTAWVCLGQATLLGKAADIARALRANDLQEARSLLPWLCGRDPDGLDEAELVRAVVESLAENTSDAGVGALTWYAVAGLPGVIAHRAANTLDAMFGYRTSRFERFGKPAARLDDVMNWVPARATAAAITLLAPLAQGSTAQAWRVWRRDGDKHPSPNGGQVEAALAGALNITLGGVNRYAGQVEQRGTLGDGPSPALDDLERAIGLCGSAFYAVCGVAVGVAALRSRWAS